jgi:ATP-dependent protease Clp ATPase subunit
MRCSFCRRHDSEVAKLVAGPFRLLAGRVYICDRCAAQTIQIMDAHSGDDQQSLRRPSFWQRTVTSFGWRRHHTSSRSECHAN